MGRDCVASKELAQKRGVQGFEGPRGQVRELIKKEINGFKNKLCCLQTIKHNRRL